MKFKDFDTKMRTYETLHDRCVPEEHYIVARIDGRSFSTLTKDGGDFEKPFDPRFRDAMIETTTHLMQCGFSTLCGYTQSDEISLLFAGDCATFGRKVRKFNSVLAAEAAAKFSMTIDKLCAFDCRVIELPSVNLVHDYFRWRVEDAHRNALNAHAYWALRGGGASARKATKALSGRSIGEKREILRSTKGIVFDDLPAWQRYGTGFFWESRTIMGEDPRNGQKTETVRRSIRVDLDLAGGEALAAEVRQNLMGSKPKAATSEDRRRLANRFLALPFYHQIAVMKQFDGFDDPDLEVEDQVLFRSLFKHAYDNKLLAKLWAETEKLHEDPALSNPFSLSNE